MLIDPVERDTAFFRLFPMRMPCLGILQLARLTPDDMELKIVDEVIEDYENDPFSPDLVGISMVFTANALRAYKVADIYRTRGVPVVLGGVHATFMPEEAKLAIALAEGRLKRQDAPPWLADFAMVILGSGV